MAQSSTFQALRDTHHGGNEANSTAESRKFRALATMGVGLELFSHHLARRRNVRMVTRAGGKH